MKTCNKTLKSFLRSFREFAQEYTPEVFGTVTMLYIDAKINGHAIQVALISCLL